MNGEDARLGALEKLYRHGLDAEHVIVDSAPHIMWEEDNRTGLPMALVQCWIYVSEDEL